MFWKYCSTAGKRAGLHVSMAIGLAIAMVSVSQAETLYDAMAKAYNSNPDIRDARAALRVVDEEVPQALSGWRPNVAISTEAGKEHVDSDVGGSQDLTPLSASLEVTQPLYRGGRTVASTDRAEADVKTARATLIDTEQDVLLAAVTAYIDVVRDEANVRLTRNNEKVLAEQLRATQDRFDVGEVTRTDVAQAQARVARAKADRLSAEGALAVSGATYERVIGDSPQDLVDVPPLPTVPLSREAAIAKAVADNPQIDRVKFNEESAGHNVRVEFGGILPTLSLVGSLESTDEQGIEDVGSDSASLMLRGTIPLYRSGVVHSQVRQAKELRNQRRIQIEQARRAVIEQATQAWEVLGTATSNVVARQSEIDANEIALEGVKEEATVGSRTVLDVLDAEQELLDARVAFIFAKRNEYVAAYSLLSAVGDLTATKQELPAKFYDPSLHYNAVRDKWFGWEIPE